jgi:hypothetical protein
MTETKNNSQTIWTSDQSDTIHRFKRAFLQSGVLFRRPYLNFLSELSPSQQKSRTKFAEDTTKLE